MFYGRVPCARIIILSHLCFLHVACVVAAHLNVVARLCNLPYEGFEKRGGDSDAPDGTSVKVNSDVEICSDVPELETQGGVAVRVTDLDTPALEAQAPTSVMTTLCPHPT